MDEQLTFRDESHILTAEYAEASMAAANRVYSIGELAAEFGVAPSLIRFYEGRGLLKPTRAGRLRVYSGRERQRLVAVLGLRRMGLPASKMLAVITTGEQTPAAAHDLRGKSILRQHLKTLQARLGEVQQMIERTSAALSCLA